MTYTPPENAVLPSALIHFPALSDWEPLKKRNPPLFLIIDNPAPESVTFSRVELPPAAGLKVASPINCTLLNCGT